jgi:2-hydroxychromene-2-carboxylate isomerase
VKTIGFWFDPISPFAYLAFERLPEALEGCSYAVEYRPVLFAGLLAHWGQKGPAEIEPKRQWTFRHVAWMAHEWGIPLQTPSTHPFNPLALLRLVVAAGANRRTVELAMRHVWRGDGAEATDAARLDALAREMKPARNSALTSRGVFGVPTFELDGKLLWGVDALPMLRAALRGEAWFDGAAWDEAGTPRPGVVRG